MAVFKSYAKYYDLLYKGKNYKKESEYIQSLINIHSKKRVKSILDVGCGTGIHANFFAKKGFEVTGLDISPEMVEIAKKQFGKSNKSPSFIVGDATNFDLGREFDVVLSLFHVIDYHITNEALEKSFNIATKHLTSGGLFIFDCWYGPAVLTDRPSLRVKKFESSETEVIRIAEPTLYPNENRVDVGYTIIVIDKKSKKVEQINEIHKVRYLFKPEIVSLMKANGMELIGSQEWLTGDDPSFNTWGVCFVGRKK